MSEDRQLVQDCLAGNTEAQQEFVRRFQSSVFGLCLRMLAHRQDAEDVAQETFTRAFRHLARWDALRPLRPWLLAIAANRCRTHLAAQRQHEFPVEFMDDPAELNRATPRLDLAEELQLAINRLREEYRLCFVLFYLNEMNLSEVAEITGNPTGTVKTWLRRARQELADHLQRRSIVPMLFQGEP